MCIQYTAQTHTQQNIVETLIEVSGLLYMAIKAGVGGDMLVILPMHKSGQGSTDGAKLQIRKTLKTLLISV